MVSGPDERRKCNHLSLLSENRSFSQRTRLLLHPEDIWLTVIMLECSCSFVTLEAIKIPIAVCCDLKTF